MKFVEFFRPSQSDEELIGKFTFAVLNELDALSQLIRDIDTTVTEALSALETEAFSASDLGVHFKNALVECKTKLEEHAAISPEIYGYKITKNPAS